MDRNIGSIIHSIEDKDGYDEAERLLESDKGTRQTATDTRVDQDLGNDQRVEREETDSYIKSYLEGDDRIRSLLIGTTRFYMF